LKMPTISSKISMGGEKERKDSVKKIALLTAWLFAAAGLVSAQVDWTNFVQTGRATREMTGGGLQAAHPTLPMGSTPTIRNMTTGREITVTVTRRISTSAERIIDISADAAGAIGLGPGGHVSVFFSDNAEAYLALESPRGANIANVVINNDADRMPGALVVSHVRTNQAQRTAPAPRIVQAQPVVEAQPVVHVQYVAPPVRRAALIVEQIEHLGIHDLSAHEVDGGVMLSLKIQFNPGTAHMLLYEMYKVYKIAEALRVFPDLNVLIAGHVDLEVRDPPDFLMWVSTERARRIASNLRDLNIPAHRLIIRGYGTERMIADPAGAQGWRNCRVEITLLEN